MCRCSAINVGMALWVVDEGKRWIGMDLCGWIWIWVCMDMYWDRIGKTQYDLVCPFCRLNTRLVLGPRRCTTLEKLCYGQGIISLRLNELMS